MAHDYSVTTNSFQEDSPPPLTTLYLSSAEDTWIETGKAGLSQMASVSLCDLFSLSLSLSPLSLSLPLSLRTSLSISNLNPEIPVKQYWTETSPTGARDS